MKINGKSFSGPATKVVVFPIGDDKIIFKLSATLDWSLFDQLCPAPVPPTITKPGGESFPDFDDADFKTAQTKWSRSRINFMAINALRDTEGLEWDQLNINDPTTWDKFESELKSAGLPDSYINYLFTTIIELNGLDQDKIERATKDFLATQAAAQK